MTFSFLDSDEAVILQSSNARLGSSMAMVDLILTNKNIVQLDKGFFGGVKDVSKYPLADLKVIDGKPNIRIGKSRTGNKQLELYFSRHEKYYVMEGLLTENAWRNAITKAYKKLVSETQKKNSSEQESVLQSLKEIVVGDRKKTAPTKTYKCPKCGAELIGAKGEDVRCVYCDALVRIK